MSLRKIDLICSRDNKKRVHVNRGELLFDDYEIRGCGSKITISTMYGIFAAKEMDYWGEDTLRFYWICPKCNMIQALDDKLLTYDEKIEIMENYAGIADEMYGFYLYKKVLRDLTLQTQNIYKLINECNTKVLSVIKDEYRDKSKLYSNWEENSEILKRKL